MGKLKPHEVRYFLNKENDYDKDDYYDDVIRNMEGAEAFSLSPENDLYTKACTSLLESMYYVPNMKDQLNNLRKLVLQLVAENKEEYVAKLAIYSQERMYLRDFPLVLAVELILSTNKKLPYLKHMVERVITRPDMIYKIVKYYLMAIRSDNYDDDFKNIIDRKITLPHQLQKGIALAFRKFDEYQFAKWNKEEDLSFRRLIRITHPKPATHAQNVVFNHIRRNKLDAPYTWERHLALTMKERANDIISNTIRNFKELQYTDNLNSFVSIRKYAKENLAQEVYLDIEKFIYEQRNVVRKKIWEEFVESNRLGYMATVMNLRSMARLQINNLDKALNYIKNKEAVKKSKLLPFTFMAAHNALVKAKNLIDSEIYEKCSYTLDNAFRSSIDNIDLFLDKKNLIAADVSGSMYHKKSKNSILMNVDVGVLFGLLLTLKGEENTFGVFGDNFMIITPKKLESIIGNNVLEGYGKFLKWVDSKVGYSTNGWKVLKEAREEMNCQFDNIVMVTDCELYGGREFETKRQWDNYKKINKDARMFLFNMASYGTVPVEPGNDVYLVSGFTKETFRMLSELVKGENNIEHLIKETIEL
jgi:60 kDa SS-A/Ro ribonucleoprotein